MTKVMNLSKEIENAKSVAISGHERPDGDCMGSTMGIYLYIKKNFPNIDTHVYLEDHSDVFNCIEGIDDIENPDESERFFDVFICADCSCDRMAQNCQILFEKAGKRINIDHHVTNANGTGDVNYVVAEASSASELVYDVLDVDCIDEEIAKALYVGIIHDTGVLQYSNVSKKTLETVAKLITYGFDFPRLIEETFYQKTYLQTKVCGKVMEESTLKLDGRVSIGTLSKKDMDSYGISSKDLDGIVNQLRQIKGVDVAIFLHELAPFEVKVSMRSTERVNVSQIAQTVGGGGHVRAAGATMKGEFKDIIEILLKEIQKQYD